MGFDPAKEAAVLRALAAVPLDAPVPVVVGVDATGTEAGAPALLTERLPGRTPSMRLLHRPSTIATLGETLAAIHAASARGDLTDDPVLAAIVPPYAPFGSLDDAVIPSRTRRPAIWRSALAEAAATPPRTPVVLMHRDFHAWNTLWAGDRLTAVVDWTSASFGPPAADLAHLRVDLATDVSVEAAVTAREAYLRAGGDATGARFHQLRTVFDYLTDTSADDLPGDAVERLDEFLAVVLEE